MHLPTHFPSSRAVVHFDPSVWHQKFALQLVICSLDRMLGEVCIKAEPREARGWSGLIPNPQPSHESSDDMRI